tara:strand:+ start:1016 stop:1516 length:501 start_codon:yes stop_codon:yes gene_type:complete
MTTCRRFYRQGIDFSLCVNMGKKDYVLAEHPSNTNTIFYYVIKGLGKLGKLFSEEFVTIKTGDFVDVRDTLYDYRTFHSLGDFHLVGFNTLEKGQNWEGRLIKDDEKLLDLNLVRELKKHSFLVCFNGSPEVNGKNLKRYEYSKLDLDKTYEINLNNGVLGFFYKN